MSAVPRWSHRDPVEGENPFPDGDPRRARWDEATVRALAALERYDAELAARTLVSGDPSVYAPQWLNLATMRLDTWARRGLAAVDSMAAQRHYAAWLEAYVANWSEYVAETCPHVAPNIRRKLGFRLAARAAHWINKAIRQPPSKRAPPDAPAV